MHDYDVLIIGGYSLGDSSPGAEVRDSIRLSYKNHYASLDFIKFLVESKGDLNLAESNYREGNRSRLVGRPLNSIYLYDFLNRNGIRTESVGYFLLEQNRFRDLMAAGPKVVAISTTFIEDAQKVVEIARAARELSPTSVIVVGGVKILKDFRKYSLFNQGYFEAWDKEALSAHSFFLNEELDKKLDALVIEECGELTLLEIARKILAGQDFRTSPNISYRAKGSLIFTERIREPYSFDKNIIRWDEIPRDMIGYDIPVRAGMGCPFKCSFCDFAGLHRVKLRTPESIIEELALIHRSFPEAHVFFTDDNLFTTRKRTKDLAVAMARAGLKIPWHAFFRTDAISGENAELLAESGCFNALLGIESGDDTVLRNMNKRATREQNLKAVEHLNRHGISTISTMIVGFPGETTESVDSTISLLNSYPDTEYPINKYYPFVFVVLPLAPINSPLNRKRYAITGGYSKWAHSTMDSATASDEFLRLFREVKVPSVAYLEYIDPDIPASKLAQISRTRDGIVKTRIRVIDKSNVQTVYESFKRILG
ncbi:MAG: radical SAM protein [Candidatus Krumholzibacteria bacterium]|nr:radical SAM protein [Candidatus Krumholzibacteria bacterium]